MLIIRYLLVFLLIISLPVWGQQPSTLKRSDITHVMNEIFEKHVDKKEMTDQILINSFRTYIDQFDPEHIYLLQSEVDPILNPTKQQITKDMQSYKNNQFGFYQQIETLIQKSIKRAETIRKALIANPDKIFTENPEALKQTFASDSKDLENRIRIDMVDFLAEQKELYGEQVVNNKRDHFLHLYENERQEWENGYLYLNDKEEPFSSKEQEHQFTLHALKALARSLDAHTSFFNPLEAMDMKTRLAKGYVGVGLSFQESPDGLKVTEVTPNTPAARSDQIKPGDILLQIDQESMKDEPIQMISKFLEGEKGSSVSLTLRHGPTGAQYTVNLKREEIVVDQDRVEANSVPFQDGLIGVVKLHSFYQSENGVSSEKDIRDAITDLRKKGKLKGLVLDLRDNMGGYLNQAVKVAGLFITNGVIVISKYYNGDEHYYRDMDGKAFYNGPLVVLISRLTASAAEIVAQSLQDYGVAVIVGDDHSFGKGSIQTQTVTGEGGDSSSLFKVTVGKYYTVSGKTPQIQGVISDILVPDHYVQEKIGERYLNDPLTPDSIPPAYNDTLQDVDASAKPWFLQYYLPTLQHKKTTWQSMLPELKMRSQNRIEKSSGVPYAEITAKGVTDKQQTNEGIKIIEDMIELRSSLHSGQIGAYD